MLVLLLQANGNALERVENVLRVDLLELLGARLLLGGGHRY